MLWPASAESSLKSRQHTLPILSATLLSFKNQWRRLSHGSRHFPGAYTTCLSSQLPWECPLWFCAFDTRSMYLNSPYGKLRWYHLSPLEYCMAKFIKTCKTQIQCAWCKHYVIKTAFPFSKKANQNIRIGIRCKTFQLSNETVRK